MPFISSMFTKEVVIPATSSGQEDCTETVNETLIAFLTLCSDNYTLMSGEAGVKLCPEILP